LANELPATARVLAGIAQAVDVIEPQACNVRSKSAAPTKG